MKLPTETVAQCPCGNVASTLVRKFTFWSPLELRRCNACGLLMVSPRLTEDAMHYVFSETYFDPLTPEVWGKRRHRIFGEVLEILQKRGVKTVFDVGAAFGHFVRFARQSGLTAVGSDLSDNAVKIAHGLGVELYSGRLAELRIPAHSFDSVVSLDTFYYTPDPKTELEAIRSILKPGGTLVLRLRNCRTTNIPSQHLWGFTPDSITALLDRHGWSVEEVLPAAYSASVAEPVHAMFVGVNKILRKASQRVPILTHSFHIVARPQNSPKSLGPSIARL